MNKKSNIIFSILIPCYNCSKYIDETIESVDKQGFNNYEIICVNDGSNDDTLIKLKRWKKKSNKIKIFTIKHGGVSVARNKLTKESSGQYCLFLDSDDKLSEGILEKLFKIVIDENPDCIIGKFNCFIEDNQKEIKCEDIDIDFVKKANQEDILNYLHSLKFVLTCWRFIIKSKIIKKSGIYFNPEVIHEDEEWVTKILLFCETFSGLDDLIIEYRRHKNSITTAQNNFNYISKLKVAENLLTFSEKYEGYKKTHILRKVYRLCKEIYYTIMDKTENL